MNFQKLKDEVAAFFAHVLGKMDPAIKAACEFALTWTGKIEVLIDSKQAVNIATLIGEEPVREDILAILKELDTVLSAVDNIEAKKAVNARYAGKIAAAQHGGGLPLGTYIANVELTLNSKAA